MQTTNFKDTYQGTIVVTYTDPYDLPTIADHQEGVSVWEVIVSVGCPGNWVYGPILASFDFDNEAWLIGAGETTWQLEYGDMYVLDQGFLTSTRQSSIYDVLRKVM